LPGIAANFTVENVDRLCSVEVRGRPDAGPQPEAIVTVGADTIRVAATARQKGSQKQCGD
jgi:hypothetical protein